MKKILAIMLALMLLIAAVPSTAFAAGSKRVYVSSTGSGTLNLRAGPGYEYKVLGYVKHNNKVKTYEEDGDWIKVKLGKKVGWIKTIYVDGTTTALGKGYKTLDYNTPGYAKADDTSAIRGNLTTSDVVKVYYTQNDMANVHIVDSNLKGWIPIDAIDADSNVKLTADTPPSSAATVYRTTASTLNLRAGAGTEYAVIGKLSRGTGCTILESKGNWRRIKTLKGTKGWVSANYLTKQANAKVNVKSLNLRKGPSTSKTILNSYKRGTKVTILYKVGNWSYVSVKGKKGYMWTNYLKY